jgi:predicted unusual protein kinase regulating ubiquinone biosynthesis (AarF/ABC1/UbiB family)
VENLAVQESNGQQRPHLCLLDFGLAEELDALVRRHFIGLLFSIAGGNGAAAARHLLAWGSPQGCPDPQALTCDMVALFKEKCDVNSKQGIDLDATMKAILRLARHHQVTVDSRYASLVVGVLVIVGFATDMDPRINLMDAAAPCFLSYALTGKVTGRLYL